jgi:hypothetical protein
MLSARMRLPADTGRPLVPLHEDVDDHAPKDPVRPLRLDGYSFRWFRVHGEHR